MSQIQPLLPPQRRPKPVAPVPTPPPYADRQATDAALAQGQAWRQRRLDAADMISTTEAAARVGATRATIVAWIGKGQCIGLSRPTRGYRLPLWQFEPAVLGVLGDIAAAMGTTDGWTLLGFLETPQGGLDGLTPRQALEQGQRARVVALAGAH